jgi:hypothetical protein
MTKKLHANDEMLHIMKIIWTSRTNEHLKGCQKMIDTFEKKHGSENIGLTLMEVEMTRQKRLNGLFAKMGKVQQTLKETQGKQMEYKKGNKK